MCGIAGALRLGDGRDITRELLEGMISVVGHRGPDGFGFYRDRRVGLAHARLSIIDLEGGWQPIRNEDGTVWIVFNGEIFNYLELRRELEEKGHVFLTRSDTEVIVHLYEELGEECLDRLNGQFALAVWDRGRERLLLARDRVGIRPLFWAEAGGLFLFGSEVKSIFMDPEVPRELDPVALDQVFTFWMTVPPRTAFRGVHELPAGHWLSLERGRRTLRRWWDPDFESEAATRPEEEYAEQLRELLVDATRLQLRADVPVGAYLSGGLDSSVVATMIRRFTRTPVRTFSVTFQDEAYDESVWQREVIEHLGTDHSFISCAGADIARVFPQVVWHAEKPILRTAPAPLFLLSGLVRESGYKVVLTGEGSDEILGGYDLFKEAKVRRFMARQPSSRLRPLLLKKLYPYLENSPIRSVRYAEAFFGADASAWPDWAYAHAPRWSTTGKAKLFFSPRLRKALAGTDPLEELAPLLGERLGSWDELSQAQYLEIKTLLSGYILSSQGDRVAMAHSVEGRFPFLDHRVMEFCFRLPPRLRLKGLAEKYLLRESVRGLLPPAVAARKKQPYMAPDARSFFRGEPQEYLEELLGKRKLEEAGWFDPGPVALLARKCRQSPVLGFKDNMALVGILSTMLLQSQFVDRFASRAAESRKEIPRRAEDALEGPSLCRSASTAGAFAASWVRQGSSCSGK